MEKWVKPVPGSYIELLSAESPWANNKDDVATSNFKEEVDKMLQLILEHERLISSFEEKSLIYFHQKLPVDLLITMVK
eukprot:11026371-Ditylum_brightwellii.AAC.1